MTGVAYLDLVHELIRVLGHDLGATLAPEESIEGSGDGGRHGQAFGFPALGGAEPPDFVDTLAAEHCDRSHCRAAHQ